MSPEDKLTIDKIAMVYAMEHDLSAALVRNYLVLVCTSDRKTLAGLEMYRNDGARLALYETVAPRPMREEVFYTHSQRLTKLLRSHGLVR
jgi:hypothetical protein